MVRIQVILNHENTGRIRALQNGASAPLNAVSKIEMRIPSLGVIIEDTVPTAYPIKWQHDPADDGLIELKLGIAQPLIDAYVLSTTGDTEAGSQWITNVPADDVKRIDKYMSVEGPDFDTVPEVVKIDRADNRIKISEGAPSTAAGTALSVYEHVKSSVHVAKFYIYNVEYPEGIYWSQVELEIGF